jgi:hypothetical protein
MPMMFFVMGASGAGKSACLESLSYLRPDLRCYDLDEGGVPADADKAWRQRRTEHWLRKGLDHQAEGLVTVVCGNAVPGEILACPSAPQVRGLHFCLLDCYDVERIDRIRRRGHGFDTMEVLCWAAWQRVHAVDPQFRPDVITDGGAEEMQWGRWRDLLRGNPGWPEVWRLDTTDLSVEQVVSRVSSWIDQTQAKCPDANGATDDVVDSEPNGLKQALSRPTQK